MATPVSKARRSTIEKTIKEDPCFHHLNQMNRRGLKTGSEIFYVSFKKISFYIKLLFIVSFLFIYISILFQNISFWLPIRHQYMC
ncbi:Hypothetical protein GbCGDNIH8_7031 [Granulibacter bethesdensis]|nr:Hypothetical protein GbCGDNIH8_7031 [Granulibacter bethesdensis]